MSAIFAQGQHQTIATGCTTLHYGYRACNGFNLGTGGAGEAETGPACVNGPADCGPSELPPPTHDETTPSQIPMECSKTSNAHNAVCGKSAQAGGLEWLAQQRSYGHAGP